MTEKGKKVLSKQPRLTLEEVKKNLQKIRIQAIQENRKKRN
jgi:hypothetical protein